MELTIRKTKFSEFSSRKFVSTKLKEEEKMQSCIVFLNVCDMLAFDFYL